MPSDRRSRAPSWRLWVWGLTGLSFFVLGLWLYRQRHDLAAIRWIHQGPVLLGLMAMYGFSAIINFAVWRARNPAVSRISALRDLYLYAHSNLSRRLPSGLGYLIVRAARYPAEGLDRPSVIVLSLQELSLQVVSGVFLTLLVSAVVPNALQVHYLPLVLCGGLFVIIGHTPLLSRAAGKISKGRLRFPERLLSIRAWPWLVPYALTWLNGGLMLHWLIGSLANSSAISVWQVELMWLLSGTLGLVGSMFPIGQFARDAVLAVLLASYVPLSVAVLVALLFRLVLTLGDVIWNLLFMLASMLTQRWYCQTR